MIGAILGDIIGSSFEWESTKDKDFELFAAGSDFTDDTVMTIAVADALMNAKDEGLLEETALETSEDRVKELLVKAMHKWGHRYPNAGYGGRFIAWLALNRKKPYNSWGNGSAMRVSPAGWMMDDIESTRMVARWTAEVTHNHPEGVKGAESVAAAIFMARNGCSKDEIRAYVTDEFGYDLDRTCDEIRPGYEFDVSCQGSVPESIIAFLDGTDYEDTVRNGVSLGGDSDTIGAMAGSIAEAFYGVPEDLIAAGMDYLTDDILDVLAKWETRGYNK